MLSVDKQTADVFRLLWVTDKLKKPCNWTVFESLHRHALKGYTMWVYHASFCSTYRKGHQHILWVFPALFKFRDANGRGWRYLKQLFSTFQPVTVRHSYSHLLYLLWPVSWPLQHFLCPNSLGLLGVLKRASKSRPMHWGIVGLWKPCGKHKRKPWDLIVKMWAPTTRFAAQMIPRRGEEDRNSWRKDVGNSGGKLCSRNHTKM